MLKIFFAVGASCYVRIFTYTLWFAVPFVAVCVPLAWCLNKAFGRVYFRNMTWHKCYAVSLMNLIGFDEYGLFIDSGRGLQ